MKYPHAGIAAIMILSILFGAYVAPFFKENNLETFQNPNDVMNIVQIFVIIIIFTAFILIVAKYKENAIKYVILITIFFTALTIFQSIFISFPYSFFIALAISSAFLLLFYKYPEWYVIDAFSIIIAGGIAGIFAISLSTWLIIALMIIMAIYDALSVYKTKHMIKLAESVTSLNLPLLVIFPKRRGYSYLKESKFGEERDAVFMGLGDIIIPGMLAINVSLFSISAFILTLIGIIAGFIVLMKLVDKGPQPGLPYLNSGAIAGYALYFVLSYIYPHLLQ